VSLLRFFFAFAWGTVYEKSGNLEKMKKLLPLLLAVQLVTGCVATYTKTVNVTKDANGQVTKTITVTKDSNGKTTKTITVITKTITITKDANGKT
jgi:uncharacterized lipoprotein YajG